MQVIINLPDNLSLTEADLRQEVAVALFQQKILLIEQAAQVIEIEVDDFYQILVDRGILTAPSDPDDPDELIFAHLRIFPTTSQRRQPEAPLWALFISKAIESESSTISHNRIARFAERSHFLRTSAKIENDKPRDRSSPKTYISLDNLDAGDRFL